MLGPGGCVASRGRRVPRPRGRPQTPPWGSRRGSRIFLGLVIVDFAWMWPIFTGGLLTYDAVARAYVATVLGMSPR